MNYPYFDLEGIGLKSIIRIAEIMAGFPMKPEDHDFIYEIFTRRSVLAGMCSLGMSLAVLPLNTALASTPIRKRRIAGSDVSIPVIGMGSWLTMDVGDNPALWRQRQRVVQTFFDEGGGMIDSSPMYGTSEKVIGRLLQRISNRQDLFAATKVWTPTKWRGVEQMKNSLRLWGIPRFDLMQIHNLVDWETHMKTLLAMKAAGRVRFIGVTTSHGRKHRTLEQIMQTQPIDFVQFTYNFIDREAENRLLPLARERGLAVIINRPFRRGGLFDRYERKPLPRWARDIDCDNWAQFFLKFVISHPAVTCAIPATTRVDHMRQNMGAGRGRLPDARTRDRMIRYIAEL